jgi:hypothetical protein
MQRWYIVAALSAGVLAAPGVASAQRHILAPGTRPAWATLGIGPTFGLVYSVDGNSRDGGGTAFRLNPQVGYHLDGDSSGPAIAGDLHFVFGDVFTFEAVARFYYDIPIGHTGLYVAPNIGLGFAVSTANTFGTSVTSPGLTIPFGVDLRLILGNRGMLFIRPLGFDLPIVFTKVFGRSVTTVAFSYDLLFGGGVTFP